MDEEKRTYQAESIGLRELRLKSRAQQNEKKGLHNPLVKERQGKFPPEELIIGIIERIKKL